MMYWLISFCLLTTSLFAQEKKEEGKKSDPPIEEVLEEKIQQTFRDIERGDLEEGVHKVAINGTVTLSYVFAESPESFVITYNFSLEEFIRNRVEVKKGEAEVKVAVKGLLAKWPTGECNLKISVGKIPYELIFNRIKEGEARVDLKFKDSILETWESNCTFTDAPGSKFRTIGTPERWFDLALKKTDPPLNRMLTQMPDKGSTTTEFKIERYLVPDVPLGSSEIEGSGKLTLEKE